MPTGEISYTNISHLTLQGTFVDNEKTTVGGIIGVTQYSVDGATSYTTITAQGTKTYGLILGVARSATVIASNCKVGGKIQGEYIASDDAFVTTNITNANYFNYIYSGTTDWTGVDAYDGCTFLATKPTTTTSAE